MDQWEENILRALELDNNTKASIKRDIRSWLQESGDMLIPLFCVTNIINIPVFILLFRYAQTATLHFFILLIAITYIPTLLSNAILKTQRRRKCTCRLLAQSGFQVCLKCQYTEKHSHHRHCPYCGYAWRHPPLIRSEPLDVFDKSARRLERSIKIAPADKSKVLCILFLLIIVLIEVTRCIVAMIWFWIQLVTEYLNQLVWFIVLPARRSWIRKLFMEIEVSKADQQEVLVATKRRLFRHLESGANLSIGVMTAASILGILAYLFLDIAPSMQTLVSWSAMSVVIGSLVGITLLMHRYRTSVYQSLADIGFVSCTKCRYWSFNRSQSNTCPECGNVASYLPSIRQPQIDDRRRL